MELTGEQRAELGRIALRQYERDIPDLSAMGEVAKATRKQKRAKLSHLRKAWEALDPDTQQDVIAHVIREWEEYDPIEVTPDTKRLANPLPDVGRIAHMLEKAISRPENDTEDHPGLTDALKFLWSLWCPQQMGGPVSIKPAIAPISAIIAPLFSWDKADAERLVRSGLYRLSASGSIERRPNSRKGRNPRPLP